MFSVSVSSQVRGTPTQVVWQTRKRIEVSEDPTLRYAAAMTPQLALQSYASPERAKQSARFFKTGPGEYGVGDTFIGVSVADCRQVVKRFTALPLPEVVKLLQSHVHEHRLTALLIMVAQFRTASQTDKTSIYKAYLANTAYINNWDLVDSSAEYIVGSYLGSKYAKVLPRLARSKDLWERRIAMLACFYFTKQANPDPALEIIEILKHDRHDLIQKAVGWMLREIGKRCSRDVLQGWLLNDKEYQRLPRTTLRYAIEHFSPKERQAFLRSTA